MAREIESSEAANSEDGSDAMILFGGVVSKRLKQ